MLEDCIRIALSENCGYQQGSPLLVAVSGGADSLSLLKVLKTLGLPLFAAHFNHHLRESSNWEASELEKLVKGWGIHFFLGEADVRAFASRKHLGLEEAARQCRYQFLFKIAEEQRLQALVTAHHADDQVETILMHFLRGAGFNGLEGMRTVGYLRQFSKEIPIWRPMLEISKAEILEYCAQNNLVYFDDESNQDLSYFRNKLRHKLIPEIEFIAPKFRQTILRNAKAIQNDNDLLQSGLPTMVENFDQEVKVDALSFRKQAFLDAILGRQTAILKEVILTLDPNLRDIGYEKLTQLVDKIKTGSRRVEIGHGLVMQVAGDTVSILRQSGASQGYPQVETTIAVDLECIPSTIPLQEGFQIAVSLMPWSAYESLPAAIKADPNQAFLSFESCHFPLKIQAPQPGLHWQPLGLVGGRQKLSDSFINSKIPQAARAQYVLVMMGDEVSWVPGLRISHVFRLKEKEPQVLHLELQQSD